MSDHDLNNPIFEQACTQLGSGSLALDEWHAPYERGKALAQCWVHF
jgi:exonuclease VII small subunit